MRAVVVLILSGATLIYGGIGLGLGMGKRLLRRTGTDARAGAPGTGLLVAAIQLLGLVPLVGVLAAAVTAVVAAGAVVLTGFGLRRYTPPDDAVDDPAPER